MAGEVLVEAAIGGPVVGVDDGGRLYPLDDLGVLRLRAPGCAELDLLVEPLRLAGLAVDGCLVYLYVAGERFAVVCHELVADQREDPPRGLVGHAKLALKLLGRHSAASARHEMDGEEPEL